MAVMLCANDVCARAGTPCSSCLPLKMKHCMNVLTTRQDSQVDTSRRGGVLFNKNFRDTDASDVGSLSAHVSLPSNDNCRYDVCDVLAPTSQPSSIVELASTDAGLCTSQPSMSSSINVLLTKAYGVSLIQSDGGPRHSPWCQR